MENSKGPAPIQFNPETLNPEVVGTLRLQHVEGVPQIVVDGNAIPSILQVVDESGKVVASYTAGPALTEDIATRTHAVAYAIREGLI